MLYGSTAFPALYLNSTARIYPPGVNLVTAGRPDLLYIRIQNRGNQAVSFWFGRLPKGPTGQGEGFLSIDPAEWTTQEAADAEALMSDFGERVSTGQIWEPAVAHTSPVYSYVSGGTNHSHVVQGFYSDREHGTDSRQVRTDV